jgi:uncharacterized protein involved in exopolysaccharide biosynthesis
MGDNWHVILRELCAKMRVSAPVRIFRSALVEVPTVVGWLRPVILLPAAVLTGLSPGQLEAVVLHELAHIRRHDNLVNALQCIIETLMFYHPAVWWVSRCIREDREHCCDDAVVRLNGDPVSYARALATLEGMRPDYSQMSMAANGGVLLSRIRRLFGLQQEGGRLGLRRILGFALLLGGVGMFVIGVYALTRPASYWAAARLKLDFGAETSNGSSGRSRTDPYAIPTEMEIIQSSPVLSSALKALDATAKKDLGAARETIDELKGRLQARWVPSTTLVDILARGDTAEHAARLGNAVAEAYRRFRVGLRQETAMEAIRSLELKLAEKDMALRKARIDLRGYGEVENTPANGETRQSLVRKRVEIQADYTQEKTLLEHLKKSPLDLVEAGLTTAREDRLLTTLLEQRNQVDQRLVALRKEFGEDHKDVKVAKEVMIQINERARERAAGMLAGMDARLMSIKAGMDVLDEEIRRLEKQEFLSSGARAALQQVEDLTKARQMLLTSIESRRLESAALAAAPVEIVERAVPPSRPTRPNPLAGGAVAGFGFMLAFAGTRLSRSIVTPV